MTLTATLTRPPVAAAQWVARQPHRLVMRYTRFRARLRILLRLTKQSKRRVKIAVWLCIGFTLSPLDFIPDFLPVVGLLDEMLVIGLTCWYVRRHDPAVARAIRNLIR